MSTSKLIDFSGRTAHIVRRGGSINFDSDTAALRSSYHVVDHRDGYAFLAVGPSGVPIWAVEDPEGRYSSCRDAS